MKLKSAFIATAITAGLLATAPLRFHSAARAADHHLTMVKNDDTPLDFSLRDLQGHELKLSQFRGHPVVVDFWATWCPPCRHQIPELKKLYAKYHQSKGLMVVGVACDTIQGDGLQSVAPFVK